MRGRLLKRVDMGEYFASSTGRRLRDSAYRMNHMRYMTASAVSFACLRSVV